ncbi:MAG: DinB family protein [Acidobacteriia bacterium]|nr:DinB family protein [Terriglobia bacterium]
MAALSAAMAESLAKYYEYIAAQLHQWAGGLTQEQFWRNPRGYGNSAGHLVLHVTGNLNYYIGARLAGTGYVRNRDLEFTDASRRSKEEVLAAFDRTIVMVTTAIRSQSEEDWMREYSAEREPEARDRFTIVLRCAGHAYHHVGQMIYICRELEKS